jgi:hypothetical protein
VFDLYQKVVNGINAGNIFRLSKNTLTNGRKCNFRPENNVENMQVIGISAGKRIYTASYFKGEGKAGVALGSYV